jgi:hypothetical protein
MFPKISNFGFGPFKYRIIYFWLKSMYFVKSRIANKELQINNCKSRIANQELQIKKCTKVFLTATF